MGRGFVQWHSNLIEIHKILNLSTIPWLVPTTIGTRSNMCSSDWGWVYEGRRKSPASWEGWKWLLDVRLVADVERILNTRSNFLPLLGKCESPFSVWLRLSELNRVCTSHSIYFQPTHRKSLHMYMGWYWAKSRIYTNVISWMLKLDTSFLTAVCSRKA